MNNIPDLEPRFLAPTGWKTDDFTNEYTNHRLHFGYASPENDPPKGIIIVLQGLQEFSEKYYEIAHFFLEHGYAITVLEWQYQGRSGRFPPNPHKRHSDEFETDIDDLKRFIEETIKPLFPDLPLHMLAHSTGGNIGLRYLIDYPNDFQTAAFSAPLIGIHGLTMYPNWLIMGLLKLFNLFPNAYVPGGSNWDERERNSDSVNGQDKFSSDPARSAMTNAWYRADPSLQGGSATMKWLLETYKSMAFLRNSELTKEIKTPCLFGIAEKDTVVCSRVSRELAEKMPSAIILDLANSKHEVLVETDDIRDLFLNSFLSLIKSQ